MSAARRPFLKTAAASTAGVVAAPLVCRHFAFGKTAPSDRVTVGVVGTGNQGFNIASQFLEADDCRVVAVCDVNRGSLGYNDPRHFRGREPGKALVDKHYGETGAGCDAYADYFELIARDDLDAVALVTPDHWHAEQSVAACGAGLDVYCEKPLSLTVREGRRMVDAVREHGRILQTGSHHRSDPVAQKLVECVRGGGVGEVRTVTTWVGYNNKTGPGPGWTPRPVPDGFDYDTWLGPAPRVPYHPDRCLYRFRFNYDYSGGQITNFGAHSNDLAAWAMPDAVHVSVTADSATFPAPGSLFDTALESRYTVTLDTGATIVCESHKPSFGLRVEGADGWVEHDGRSFTASTKALANWQTPESDSLGRGRGHVADFLHGVKTREEPIAPVEAGHAAAVLCHLGSQTLRLRDFGTTYGWDAAAERFTDSAGANALLGRGGAG